MKQNYTKVRLLLAGSAALSILAISPLAAARGGDDTTATSGSRTSSSSQTTTETEHATETSGSVKPDGEHPTTSGRTATTTAEDSIKTEAQDLLASERQKSKQHTTEERQKSCQAHQAELTTRSANYASSAQKHLDTFNGIFTKVQAFHDSKQVNAVNYDTLVATAKTKQAAAQTAVDALKALNIKIDCTQPDPAGSVATLKTAVSNARTALHDYRQAIKDVVVSLKAASGDTSTSTSTTTGGN